MKFKIFIPILCVVFHIHDVSAGSSAAQVSHQSPVGRRGTVAGASGKMLLSESTNQNTQSLSVKVNLKSTESLNEKIVIPQPRKKPDSSMLEQPVQAAENVVSGQNGLIFSESKSVVVENGLINPQGIRIRNNFKPGGSFNSSVSNPLALPIRGKSLKTPVEKSLVFEKSDAKELKSELADLGQELPQGQGVADVSFENVYKKPEASDVFTANPIKSAPENLVNAAELIDVSKSELVSKPKSLIGGRPNPLDVKNNQKTRTKESIKTSIDARRSETPVEILKRQKPAEVGKDSVAKEDLMQTPAAAEAQSMYASIGISLKAFIDALSKMTLGSWQKIANVLNSSLKARAVDSTGQTELSSVESKSSVISDVIDSAEVVNPMNMSPAVEGSTITAESLMKSPEKAADVIAKVPSARRQTILAIVKQDPVVQELAKPFENTASVQPVSVGKASSIISTLSRSDLLKVNQEKRLPRVERQKIELEAELADLQRSIKNGNTAKSVQLSIDKVSESLSSATNFIKELKAEILDLQKLQQLDIIAKDTRSLQDQLSQAKKERKEMELFAKKQTKKGVFSESPQAVKILQLRIKLLDQKIKEQKQASQKPYADVIPPATAPVKAEAERSDTVSL